MGEAAGEGREAQSRRGPPACWSRSALSNSAILRASLGVSAAAPARMIPPATARPAPPGALSAARLA